MIYAAISQMCVTAIANLQQATQKKGKTKFLFHKDEDIIPFMEQYWEAMTTMPRRVTQSWYRYEMDMQFPSFISDKKISILNFVSKGIQPFSERCRRRPLYLHAMTLPSSKHSDWQRLISHKSSPTMKQWWKVVLYESQMMDTLKVSPKCIKRLAITIEWLTTTKIAGTVSVRLWCVYDYDYDVFGTCRLRSCRCEWSYQRK